MDGSFGMQARWPSQVFVVFYELEHPVMVAFDREFAETFAKHENDEVECEIMNVEAVTLVDDFGFHCRPADMPFLRHETTLLIEAEAYWTKRNAELAELRAKYPPRGDAE
jgi:hypothetical protein